ncbi:hypothetical protein E2493_12110 [Sphingomonas parva]|uniref:Colicin transporter n=1 Tax=Sphingomonas parva TaxID=2555898 RepID=A0A4Y8ZPP9_9SPHN|nr:hypothetical protein [Sphingomonas parva]TFI57934.1 hypothetical protein E2493_12110 [Sphingomonas parva]
MIVQGFKSVIWVATVGGAALSCYMVSLQVATERAELVKVERQIIAAKREIRSLQTELGTRGRLSQLEQWNAEVLALAAPSSAQYLSDGVKLARFERRDPTLGERAADVRMAAMHTGEPAPTAPLKPAIVRAVAAAPVTAAPTVQRASFTPTVGLRQMVAAAKPVERKPAAPQPASVKAVATSAKPVATAKGEAAGPAKLAAARDAVKPAADTKAAARPDAKPAARSEPKIVAKAPAAKPRTSRLDGKLVAEINSAARKGQGSGGN